MRWSGLPRVTSVRVALRVPVRAGFHIKNQQAECSLARVYGIQASVLTEKGGVALQ